MADLGTSPAPSGAPAGGTLRSARLQVEPLHQDDVSDLMIEQARQRLHRDGIGVAFEHADVCSLPYAAGEFDVVIAAHVLEHLPNPVVALKEIQRVLKPGGWVVMCLIRESILGRYVQLKWRTHRLTAELGESWLSDAGLTPRPMKLTSTGLFRLTSLPCIGRKPAQP